VFIFVLTLVVIVVILLMGTNFLFSQKETSSKFELASLHTKVVEDISSTSSEFGAFERVAYQVHDVRKLCFVDLSLINTILDSDNITAYPLMRDSLGSGTGKNVFVYGKSLEDSFYGGELTVIEFPHFKCVEVLDGELRFALEWKRGNARILPGMTPLGSEMTLEDFISIIGEDISTLDEFEGDLDDVDPTLNELDS